MRRLKLTSLNRISAICATHEAVTQALADQALA
jgi:hypothetical protein